jgi:hypothetical protein
VVGLVACSPNPTESRSALVRLTHQGRKNAQDLFRIGRDMLQEMTADWTPIELAKFSTLMQRMSHAPADYEQRLRQSGPTTPRSVTGVRGAGRIAQQERTSSDPYDAGEPPGVA